MIGMDVTLHGLFGDRFRTSFYSASLDDVLTVVRQVPRKKN